LGIPLRDCKLGKKEGLIVKIQVKQQGVLDLGQGKIQYSSKDL
jgi:hypothetical protein